MKQIFTLGCALALGALSVMGTANGEQVRATNIFEGKLLSSISTGPFKTTLNYNDKNQLISATTKYEDNAYLDYTGGQIDRFDYDVSIIEMDEDDVIELYIRLNPELFAAEVYEVEKEVGDPTRYNRWTFEYTPEGCLCKVTKSEEDQQFTLTYEGGNITSVLKEERDGYYISDTYEIYYTDQIANTSGFMIFDSFFGVDLDEMEIAYFAGMLGRPTKCLPQKLYDVSDRDTEIFKWTIDAQGYPTKVNVEGEILSLVWKDAAGIMGVEEDVLNKTPIGFFNASGMPLSQLQKGLYIIRYSDGTASKVLIK